MLLSAASAPDADICATARASASASPRPAFVNRARGDAAPEGASWTSTGVHVTKTGKSQIYHPSHLRLSIKSDARCLAIHAPGSCSSAASGCRTGARERSPSCRQTRSASGESGVPLGVLLVYARSVPTVWHMDWVDLGVVNLLLLFEKIPLVTDRLILFSKIAGQPSIINF